MINFIRGMANVMEFILNYIQEHDSIPWWGWVSTGLFILLIVIAEIDDRKTKAMSVPTKDLITTDENEKL